MAAERAAEAVAAWEGVAALVSAQAVQLSEGVMRIMLVTKLKAVGVVLMTALGLTTDDVNQSLNMYLGSLYVNNFNEFGRYWQVTVQAEGHFRSHISDINLIKVYEVDLNDPPGARRGIFAFQIHSGGPMEVRFKDLKLEVLTPAKK